MTGLLQRTTEDIQPHNLAPKTQLSYLRHVSRFARHFGKPPAPFGTERDPRPVRLI